MEAFLFLTKKIISVFCYPLGAALLIGLVGLSVSRGKNKPRAGYYLVLFAWLVLVVFSLPVTGGRLLNSLEKMAGPRAEPRDLAAQGVRDIVVLGGGANGLASSTADRLKEAGLRRVLEGVRLWKAMPGARLFFSGGNPGSRVSEARLGAEMALELGVPAEAIFLEDQSRDTEDQAARMAKKLEGRPFALLTSAGHLPRSLMLFREQGLNPVPAPTDFQGRVNEANPLNYLPSSFGLMLSDRAVHEYLGICRHGIRKALALS
ncbi:MAG: ElyC/SanA/YdcF family protein [Pseudomonadota bacterium]